MSTPAEVETPRHSAPGAVRVACRMPKLWEEHPDLDDVRPVLHDAMTRIHDWADLFDLYPQDVINRAFKLSAEANTKRSEEAHLWDPVLDVMAGMKQTVDRMGDQVFATWIESGDREAGTWTFRETWDAAGAVAHALVNQWGVQSGDRVILCYNFSFEYFPAFLGCLRAGAIACPVYPIDPSKMEIALTKFKHVVKDTGARLVLTDKLINRVRMGCSVFYGHLMPKTVEWKVTDAIVGQKGKNIPSYDYQHRKPSDVAFLQYTSGSTGDPKGVVITFKNLGANVGLISGAQQHAFNYGDQLPLTYLDEDTKWYSRSRSVSWLPMYHDMGLVYGVVTPFFAGARMHYMSPITFLKDPCSWIRLLAKYNCTWSAGPDFAYRLCAKKWDAHKWPTTQYSLTYMMYMHTGAEPIRQATLEEFNKVFRPYHLHARALSPCYGLAESVVCVSWYDPIANDPRSMYSSDKKPGYICCAADFRVDLRVVDPDTCEEVEDGVAGELWVSGPSVAAGYWNKPEISEASFRATLKGKLIDSPWAKFGDGKYLRTGDSVFMEEERIYYSGRMKDMIIVRGQNFYAQDIEFPAQDAWTAIRGGCIAAFSTDIKGMEEEQLEVVFELAPGKYGIGELQENFRKVSEAIRKNTGLSTYRMVAVKDRTIPKTTSGKIRRRATKEALAVGTLSVIYDSLGILVPGKKQAVIAETPDGRPRTLTRQASSSYLASIGDAVGGILGSIYDAIADPLGAVIGLESEVITGPLNNNESQKHINGHDFPPNDDWSTIELGREGAVDDDNGYSIGTPTSCKENPKSQVNGGGPTSSSAQSSPFAPGTPSDSIAVNLMSTQAEGFSGAEQQGHAQPKSKDSNGTAAAPVGAVEPASISKEELRKLSWRQREAAIVELVIQVCRSVGVEKEHMCGETDMITLGLSSIKAAHLVGDIESRFGVEGSLSEVILYECATIQDVAQLINRTFFEGVHRKGEGPMLTQVGDAITSTARWLGTFCVQAVALGYTGGLLALSFLLPLQICLALLSSSSGGLIAAFLILPVVYLLHLFILMALTTLTKWMVIGQYRAGAYPVNGLYYARWAMIDALLRFTTKNFLGVIRGSQLHTLWLRSLGLRGQGLPRLFTEDISEFDLVTVGEDTIVEEGARIRGAVVEGGQLLLKEVEIGCKTVIGAQSTILPGAIVGDNAIINPTSVISGRSPAVPPFTQWGGSPVKQLRSLSPPADSVASTSSSALYNVILDLGVPCAAVVAAGVCIVCSAVPALALVGGALDTSLTRDMSWLWLIGPFIALFGPLAIPFYGVMDSITSGTLAGTGGSTLLDITWNIAKEMVVLRVGVYLGIAYCIFGGALIISAAVLQRGCGALVTSQAIAEHPEIRRRVVEFRDILQSLLHSRCPAILSGTKGYNLYLQAVGANVHRDAFVASENGFREPELLFISEGVFVHPLATLQPEAASSALKTERAQISLGQGAVIGYNAVASPGSSLEAESTLTPLSHIESGRCVLSNTSKCGNATLLRLKHPIKKTGASSTIANYAYSAFSWLYAPVAVAIMMTIVYTASYPAFLIILLGTKTFPDAEWLPGLLMAALFPVFGLCLMITAIIVKLVVIQSYTTGTYPLEGSYFYRHLFVSVYLRLVDRTFACLLRGTRTYNTYLRVLGVQVGDDAIVLTSEIEGTDLISIGHQTIIGRDVQLSAAKLNAGPTPTEKILEFSPVVIGHECTLGDSTVAMASSDVKDLGMTAAGTLLTPEIMVGRRAMVEGNLPYRVIRTSKAGNLIEPSEPFNSPLAMIRADTNLGHGCAFYSHLSAAVPAPVTYRGATVLVTGANGFVGRHLIHELLGNGHQVYALVRSNRDQSCRDRMLSALGRFKSPEHEKRLRVVDGDVSKQRLGLHPTAYETLAAEVTVVFHCATILGFAAPYANLRSANVVGTKYALEFAAYRRIKRFNHVSSILATSLDMTNPKGRIAESAPLGDATVFPVIGASEWTHGYGLSKWCQEILVQQAAKAGLPITVTRLGEVGPNSRTGFMMDGVLVDLFQDTLETGLVPQVLGSINITPVDYCARGILHVGTAEWGVGRTYHLLDPRFELTSEITMNLFEDLGHQMQSCDFLTWRRKMKAAGVGKSWFIAGVLSGEQQLVGQNFDCTDGAAVLASLEKADIDVYMLLRRFAQDKKLGKERKIEVTTHQIPPSPIPVSSA